jgi:hypothetical protein
VSRHSSSDVAVIVVLLVGMGVPFVGCLMSGKATVECKRRKCTVGVPRRDEGTNYECRCVTYPD